MKVTIITLTIKLLIGIKITKYLYITLYVLYIILKIKLRYDTDMMQTDAEIILITITK